MPRGLAAHIQRLARSGELPDGTTYHALSITDVASTASSFNISPLAVETAALENEVVPERYARNLKTYTPAEQARLLKARVAIVGLGGLGGAVTEILARLGVGTMTLIDGDCFEAHNLNRQLLSTGPLMGISKAAAAAQRVAEINPAVVTAPHSEFLADANAHRLLQHTDVVIDCLDTVTARFILERGAKKLAIPMVSAAVAGVSGQVTVVFPEDPGLELVYGDPAHATAKGAETALGCLPQAVILIASLEAAEAVKIILQKKTTLRNQLLLVDLTDNTFEQVSLI